MLKRKALITCLVAAVLIAILVQALLHSNNEINGRVYVAISRELEEAFKGYALGTLFISMISPSGYKSYHYYLKEVIGRTLELDFGDVVASWVKFYKESASKPRGSLSLPTISITITLYKDDLECIATYTYSTVDFFLERGLTPVDAAKKAAEDPLAHLRKPLPIVLRPKMPKGEISAVCIDLSPRLEKLKSILGEVHGTSSQNLTARALQAQAATGSCPAYFEEVWWSALYNSRDEPPNGWMSNIYPERSGDVITDEEKKYAWRYYAETYSKAYYFRKDVYALDNVLYFAYLELGPEGVYSMDGWISRLFMKIFYKPAQWRDYHENYGYRPVIEGNVPYLGVRIINPDNKAISIAGSLAVARYREYKSGITVAGVIVAGRNELSLVTVTWPIAAFGTEDFEYVTMPTSFTYISDGAVLKYDIKSTSRYGCEYWRLAPLHTLIPIYDVAIDFLGMNETTRPDHLSEVMNSYIAETVYKNSIRGVGANTILYEDANTLVRTSRSDLASIVHNVVMVTKVLANLALNLVCAHPVCIFISTIVSELVNFAYEDLEQTAIGFRIVVETYDYVDYAVVEVVKATLKSTEAYYIVGWLPVMVEYRVYVNYDYSVPCDTTCPISIPGPSDRRLEHSCSSFFT